MPADLRERVAREISPQAFVWGATAEQQAWALERADAVLALYVAHLTNDAAVERAMDKWFGPRLPHRNQVDRDDMRAAILAALEEAE